MPNEHPDITRTGQTSAGSERRPPGLIASIVLEIGLLAVLIWQFAGVADDGQQFQVLDPDLHLVWKAVIVVVVGVSTACKAVAWFHWKWTMPLAITNTAANWVAAALVIALTVEGELFAPTLPGHVATTFGTTSDLSGLTEPFLLVVAGLSIWDSLDGFLQARRADA